MSEPYIGELRLFAGNFAPRGWAFCDGQLLTIAENAALFALIGPTYGGDGRDNFGLPDLRGRVPIHRGTGPGLSPRTIGERAGEERVTLTAQQLPVHTHVPGRVSEQTATSRSAVGNVRAVLPEGKKAYAVPQEGPGGTVRADVVMASTSQAGGNQPHDNVQPYLGINYIIALTGVYPSRP